MRLNLLKTKQTKTILNLNETNIGHGMMIILSSPSGAGKTTLTKKIAKKNKNFTISVSHTTRNPRLNETNGKDYFFVSKKSFFQKLIKKKSFFEHAKIFNNHYGTMKKPVLR